VRLLADAISRPSLAPGVARGGASDGSGSPSASRVEKGATQADLSIGVCLWMNSDGIRPISEPHRNACEVGIAGSWDYETLIDFPIRYRLYFARI
jgi:hypothetical protein